MFSDILENELKPIVDSLDNILTLMRLKKYNNRLSLVYYEYSLLSNLLMLRCR